MVTPTGWDVTWPSIVISRPKFLPGCVYVGSTVKTGPPEVWVTVNRSATLQLQLNSDAGVVWSNRKGLANPRLIGSRLRLGALETPREYVTELAPADIRMSLTEGKISGMLLSWSICRNLSLFRALKRAVRKSCGVAVELTLIVPKSLASSVPRFSGALTAAKLAGTNGTWFWKAWATDPERLSPTWATPPPAWLRSTLKSVRSSTSSTPTRARCLWFAAPRNLRLRPRPHRSPRREGFHSQNIMVRSLFRK